MKITELDWTDGKRYIYKELCGGAVVEVYHGDLKVVKGEDLTKEDITSHINIKDLLEKDFKEYIKPVDWSKVEVDTKILVSDDNINWHKRHFARYWDEIVRSWDNGCTSFTNLGSHDSSWQYAKLADEED